MEEETTQALSNGPTDSREGKSTRTTSLRIKDQSEIESYVWREKRAISSAWYLKREGEGEGSERTGGEGGDGRVRNAAATMEPAEGGKNYSMEGRETPRLLIRRKEGKRAFGG